MLDNRAGVQVAFFLKNSVAFIDLYQENAGYPETGSVLLLVAVSRSTTYSAGYTLYL